MGIPIKIPNGILTLAGFDRDNAKRGHVYKCTKSMIKDRIGQIFEIKTKSDIDYIDFLSGYGDNFKLIQDNSKKVPTLKSK